MPFRYYVNRDPGVARDRKELANLYRRIRKDRPDMARLLYKRYKAVVQAGVEKLDSLLYHG